jgi:tetratricopeptide (TPR) repeat protein
VLLSCLAAGALWFTFCGRPASERAINFGERLQDVLNQSEPIRSVMPLGRARRWVFAGRAGQTVVITAESFDLDLYLLLMDSSGRQIACADDNGELFNPRIEVTLQSTGKYTVVACGSDADQYGTYWINLADRIGAADWSEQAARASYQRGVEWALHSGDRRALTRLDVQLSRYYRQRGRWEDARQLAAQAHARALEDGFSYGEWAASLESGRLFARLRSHDRAIAEFDRARDAAVRTLSADEATTLIQIEMGNLYQASANPDLAILYYNTAKRQAETYARPSLLVQLYTALSSLSQRDEPLKAIEYAGKAVRSTGEIGRRPGACSEHR